MKGELSRYRYGSYANVSSSHCIYRGTMLASCSTACPAAVFPALIEPERLLRGDGVYSYLMVLPVLNRIHCGMGLFCFCARASFCLVRKVLWLCNHISSVSVALKKFVAQSSTTASTSLCWSSEDILPQYHG